MSSDGLFSIDGYQKVVGGPVENIIDGIDSSVPTPEEVRRDNDREEQIRDNEEQLRLHRIEEEEARRERLRQEQFEEEQQLLARTFNIVYRYLSGEQPLFNTLKELDVEELEVELLDTVVGDIELRRRALGSSINSLVEVEENLPFSLTDGLREVHGRICLLSVALVEIIKYRQENPES